MRPERSAPPSDRAPFAATTGKVERFHKTWRKEFVAVHDYQYQTVVEAQAALDAWVAEYNTTRPHQSLGDRPPAERFSRPAPASSRSIPRPERSVGAARSAWPAPVPAG